MNFNFTGTYDGKGRMPDIPKRANDLTPGEIATLVDHPCYVHNDIPKPFIIEIGCNDGETTEQFCRAMPTATIWCIEPDSSAQREWSMRMEPLRAAQNANSHLGVQLFAGACAHRNQKDHPFWPSHGKWEGMPPHKANWNMSGGLSKPTGHLKRDTLTQFGNPVPVAVRQLDSVLMLDDTVQPAIDFIWCDSQGSEAKVILGARDTLLLTRYFYTEFYDTAQYDRQPDLYGIYCMLPDFDPIGIFGENCLFKNRDFD